MPSATGRRGDVARIQLRRDLARRQTGEFREDRPQLLGAIERLVTILDAASIEAAQLEALGLLGGQCVSSALRDQPALFLRQGGIDVQHERIAVIAQLSHDERHFVSHQAADEMYITTEATELCDDD